MKIRKAIIFLVVILIIVKIIFAFPFFKNLECKAQDMLFRIRGKLPTTDNIAIIAIDDASFSALDETWPFPRDYHSKLIENLNKAGVKQIIFDVEFTENSFPESDLRLAKTAAKYQNVIFAGKVLPSQHPGEPTQMIPPINAILDYNLPWGIVNMGAEPDGFIRKYTLFEEFDQSKLYSLGIASLANLRVYQSTYADHIKVADRTLHLTDKSIPIIDKNKALINFRGPSGTYPSVSYASVLDDSTFFMPGYQGAELNELYDIIESGILKDKIVLVGATIDELHDKFPTPYGGEWTPGVEIQANFIDMVLTDSYLKELNLWLYLLVEIILLIGLWFLFKLIKPQFSAIALIGLLIIEFIVTYLLFSSSNIICPIAQTVVLLILIYVASILNHYLDTLKEKRFIRNAFQQYLAPELVNQLLANPKNLKYGGSLQEITVLFSDIRNFTTYSEKHSPEETVNILHQYFTEMVNIIIDNNGILDKFVGDEIMALYGTPIPLPNHALDACKSALKMRERLIQLQEKWISEGYEPFEMGIGINTGMAVVGNLGSEQIFDYTAIGDTINLGARLESLNKEYDTFNHIIISEYTYEKVKDLVNAKYLDEVKVKGKNIAVKIYELISLS
ncbi:MAG: adenylate/guanylate cyclase domain-containing protein [Candidatus Cloacimonetes bacterium]|nr:adenylate/guanylate cyclase domain-containing protein [Candidatus Cloacimonadota bacterium]